MFFNFPVEGATVTGSVGIQATATDNLGLVQAAWLVDGVAVQSSAIDGVRAVAGFVWDATSCTQGIHTVTTRITDEAGNVSSADLTLVKH